MLTFIPIPHPNDIVPISATMSPPASAATASESSTTTVFEEDAREEVFLFDDRHSIINTLNILTYYPIRIVLLFIIDCVYIRSPAILLHIFCNALFSSPCKILRIT